MASDLSKTTYFELLASYEQLLDVFDRLCGKHMILAVRQRTPGSAELHERSAAEAVELVESLRGAVAVARERIRHLKSQIAVH